MLIVIHPRVPTSTFSKSDCTTDFNSVRDVCHNLKVQKGFLRMSPKDECFAASVRLLAKPESLVGESPKFVAVHVTDQLKQKQIILLTIR